jgi:integrase
MGEVVELGAKVASTQECVDALAHWRRVRGHSEGTIYLDTWILTAIGVPPQLATIEDLERLVTRNRNKGSRATYASRIHSIFTALRKMRIITTTVDEDLPRLKAPENIPRPLSDDQVDRLLTTMTGPALDAVRIGLLAGTRAMEVCAMRGDDLSWGQHGPELLLHGKGGKDVAIPAHPTVVKIVESHGTLGKLFPQWSTPCIVSRMVGNQMRAALGGDRVTFHQCRHTFGTRLLAASDHDLLLVSKVMRHASIATTLGYVKLADERPRLAIDRLAG